MGNLTRRTAPRIAVVNGTPTTTSRDIAETFGKEHRTVLRNIREMECSAEFRVHNFVQAPYVHPQNGQTLTEYHITRDGFAFLCMGFTGARAAQWKERYIAHFNRMAATLADRQGRKSAGKNPQLPKPDAHGQLPQSEQTGPTLRITHQPDPARLIGAGLPQLNTVLPPELHAAAAARAFELANQAAPLLRDYVLRRVGLAINGHGHLVHPRAQELLRTASLSDAILHAQHAELEALQATARIVRTIANQSADAIEAAIQAHGKHPTQPATA